MNELTSPNTFVVDTFAELDSVCAERGDYIWVRDASSDPAVQEYLAQFDKSIQELYTNVAAYVKDESGYTFIALHSNVSESEIQLRIENEALKKEIERLKGLA